MSRNLTIFMRLSLTNLIKVKNEIKFTNALESSIQGFNKNLYSKGIKKMMATTQQIWDRPGSDPVCRARFPRHPPRIRKRGLHNYDRLLSIARLLHPLVQEMSLVQEHPRNCKGLRVACKQERISFAPPFEPIGAGAYRI